jgi:hypothetical protein
MVLLDGNPNDVDKHCKCINDLTYLERADSLDKIFNNRHILPKGIERIIIYSFIDFAKVGLNSVGLTIKRGNNITCLCDISGKGVNLHITSYFLSNLIKVKKQIANCEAFILTPKGHKGNCKNSLFPSLYEIAYASAYINGLTPEKLKILFLNKIIPKDIFLNRPTLFVHIPLFHLNTLRGFYAPLPTGYTVGCGQPILHLETCIDHIN